MEQPGAECLGELLGAARPDRLHRRQRLLAKVGQRLGIRGEHQLGEAGLGVRAELQRSRPQRPCVRRGRLEPGPGRAGDCVAALDRAEDRGAASTVGVGDQQQRRIVEPGHLTGLKRAGGERAEHRSHLRLRDDHSGQRARRLPLGALGGLDDGLGRGAGEQVVGDPLLEPLPDPPGCGQLVGVPGDAGGRQLVDVGEHQLRERHQSLGVQPVLHGRRRHLVPRHPRADAVRRQQRVGGPTAAGLAAAELVGALHCRGSGCARIGAAAAAGQGEEPAERELHGVADGLAHRTAECVLVAGHLVDDRGDDLLGHGGQLKTDLSDGLLGQQQPVPRRTPGGKMHFVPYEQSLMVDSRALHRTLACLRSTLKA